MFNKSDFKHDTTSSLNHSFAFNDKDLLFNDTFSRFNISDFYSNISIPDYHFPPGRTSTDDILSIVYIAIGLAGIIANMLQIGCICHKGKKRTTFDLVLLSHCVSDVVVLVPTLLANTIMLFTMTTLVLKILVTAALSTYFSVFSSLFHGIFIALQRICAVVVPFKVKRLFSTRRCLISIFFIWLSSIGLPFATVFALRATNGNHISITGLGYSIILSTACLIFLYSILLFLIKRRPAISCSSRANTNKRVIVHSFSLIAVFVCCFLPIGIVVLYKGQTSAWFSNIARMFFLFNPLFNSMLYFFVSYCRTRMKVQNNNTVELRNYRNSASEK